MEKLGGEHGDIGDQAGEDLDDDQSLEQHDHDHAEGCCDGHDHNHAVGASTSGEGGQNAQVRYLLSFEETCFSWVTLHELGIYITHCSPGSVYHLRFTKTQVINFHELLH